jgi:hypothetical protein
MMLERKQTAMCRFIASRDAKYFVMLIFFTLVASPTFSRINEHYFLSFCRGAQARDYLEGKGNNRVSRFAN